MTADYLALLKEKKSQTHEPPTDKTDETPGMGSFVGFVSTPRAHLEKNQPVEPLPVTPEWFRAQGCEVLREDLVFIKGRLPTGTVKRNAMQRAYAACWLAAMDQEPLSHRKENAGRFAANTALREGLLQKGCSGTECA